jgi:O-antigen/teichoic acid export membrane protein
LRVAGQPALATALFGLAIANPCILFLWLMRRSCYVVLDPRLAAGGNICYMAVLLPGAYVLANVGRLSAPLAFALMGSAGLVAGMWIKSRLPFACSSDGTRAFRREIAADHLAYGRWAVGTGVLGAITLNLYYMVMPVSRGLEPVAELRALTNLVLPALQSYWVLTVLATPKLVKVRGTPAFGAALRRLLILYMSCAVIYWIAIGSFHAYLVDHLYGGRYTGQSQLLWPLGFMPVIVAAVSTLEGALRAMERPDEIFRAYVIAVVCTCVAGIPLMVSEGVSGAVIGLLLSYGCALGSMGWSLRALHRRHLHVSGATSYGQQSRAQ